MHIKMQTVVPQIPQPPVEKEPPAPPTLSVSSRPVISLFGLLQSDSSDESYVRKLPEVSELLVLLMWIGAISDQRTR